MKNKKKTRYLTELALLVAILLVMNITGLAMIPLPGQYASIMTVPVAIGAIMLGPLGGGIMGFAMGAISFYTAVKDRLCHADHGGLYRRQRGAFEPDQLLPAPNFDGRSDGLDIPGPEEGG